MKIHAEGKISARKVKSYDDILNRIKSNSDNFLPENAETVARFVRDARLGKTLQGRAKKKVGEKRLLKYISTLKILDGYIQKPFEAFTMEDSEKFILDLEEGNLTYDISKAKNRPKPYAPETQVNLKKLLKKFYKWLQGNGEEYPETVKWFDTSCELPEFKALTFESIKNMLILMISTKHEAGVKHKALVMALFDGGFRVEELMNVRIRNMEFKDNVYWIRIEHSKTQKRTVPLPASTKQINDWMDVHSATDNPNAQLFPMTYDGMRKAVKRAGKAIKVNITPHDLRHSSATFWCNHLNHANLCARFGWGLNSKMPQRYIDRSGISQTQAIKVFKSAQEEAKKEEQMIMFMKMQELVNKFERIEKMFPEEAQELKKIIKIVQTN